jgi:hypothetical protein
MITARLMRGTLHPHPAAAMAMPRMGRNMLAMRMQAARLPSLIAFAIPSAA